MKKGTVISLVVAFVVICLASFGGIKYLQVEAKNQAMKNALVQLTELRSAQDGLQAVVLKKGIESGLANVGLKTSDISLKNNELDNFVRAAYVVEAKRAYAHLIGAKASPNAAEGLRKKIFAAVESSGDTLKEIGIVRTDIDRMVARNYLESAARQGVKISPADYRAAGLKPHVIVRKVPVKITKLAKVVKKK